MRKLYLHVLVGLLVVGLSVAVPSLDLYGNKNFTGYTLKSGPSAGCTCHSQGGSVALSGPASLTVGQAGSYTVTLGGSTKTGVNVAASNGTLTPVSSNMVLNGGSGELTFSAARNSSTWQFTYTPTTAGSKTLYAAGDINGFQGTWNHATNFSVTASDPVSSVADVTPPSFELEQNFPNPFNPSTTIRYSIASTSSVALQIYSITGELVTTLVNQSQDAGIYQVQFVDPGMSSGVYIYRLEARPEGGSQPGFVATRKLALLK